MAKDKKGKGRFSKLSEVEKALRIKEEASTEFLPGKEACDFKNK
jgi:hypothetical protein